MRMRFIYFAGSLLFVGLLVSEFALSSNAAKAILQPRASANTTLQPLPTLRGTEAVERLKEEGLYSSLAEAVAAADPLIVQQAKLTANDGVDGDAFGGSVAISGDTAVIGASQASLNAPAQGSVHVFVRSGRSWTRQARLTAPGAAASDHFGASVAISGDTLVAGAPDDDIDTNMDQGSAHVFSRSSGTWIHLKRIMLNDGGANYHFGASVAIGVDTVVIGTPGAEGNKGLVYVFALDGGIWIERQKLAAPDGAASDRFGASVAIDADTIVAGAPYHDVGPNTDQGAAYVFARNGENWNQRQKLTAQNGAANANFGASVAIDADTIVAGAPNHSESAGNNRGAAYVFAFEDAYWTQKAKLTAPDGAMFDAFGASVAIDAGTAVIGAWGADRGSGAAHVFARSGAKWSRLQRLAADDGAPSVFFGKSVAISGNTMMIGTPRISGGLHQSGLGAAYALVISGNLAQRQKFQIDAANIDPFAHSVAVSGDLAVVGMKRDTVGANTNQGSVYVFARGDGDWIQQQMLTAPDGRVADFFGHSVAISGNTVAVGAPYHNVGPNADQGAVYVFTSDGASWGPPLKLTANDGMAWSQFGWSLAIDADTLVIGSPGDDRVQGSTYVFARSGVDWIQRQKLTASDGATSDEFGRAAAIDADMIVIGATDAAYLFARSNQNWVQWQKLTADDGSVYDSFGYSVAISGDTVVVGAPTSDRGSAYVFARNPLPWIDPWSQRQKLTPLDGESSNYFGVSIAISGGIIVIGVMVDDIGQNRGQGSAYIFVRRLEWEQHQKLTVTDGATADLFGSSVALSGDTVMAMKTPLAYPTIDHRRPSALYVFSCSGCPKIEMDQVMLPEAVVGDPYDQTFTANGGASPYEFSLSSGSLPPGLNLLKSGLLSGYPLTAGAYNFTITATDSNHCPGGVNYTLIVRSPCPAITIKTDLSSGAVGQPYSQKFGAAGGTAPYSFKISDGSAPPGLKLSAEGEIYGVPTNAGAFKFTVTASDANGCAGSRDYTLTINK